MSASTDFSPMNRRRRARRVRGSCAWAGGAPGRFHTTTARRDVDVAALSIAGGGRFSRAPAHRLRRTIARAISPRVNIREHVALLDERLDRLSVGRRLVASLGFEPRSVELAVYQPDSSYTAER